MSEIDMDRINAEIEGEIRKYANSVELAADETVLRVTIHDAVVLEQDFAMNWWLDFIGQSVFHWRGRAFYCCDVEPTEDSHVWICHWLNLQDDFPLRIAQGSEAFKQGQLEPEDASETQMPEWS